jgi:hypothetical protein
MRDFFLTHPHAEERSGAAGARLEARAAGDAARSCPVCGRLTDCQRASIQRHDRQLAPPLSAVSLYVAPTSATLSTCAARISSPSSVANGSWRRCANSR